MIYKKHIKGSMQGSSSSQRAFFEHYVEWIMGIAVRYVPDNFTARDITQETFIIIFKKLPHFKFQSIPQMETWMRKITIRCALQYLRKRKKPPDLPEKKMKLPADTHNADHLLHLIRELPEGYRTVFNLYAIEGYSHKEIGSLLNITASASRSQLHRARQLLQQKLESEKTQKHVLTC